ncbi:MAG TPA: universal stress protein, partial [Pedobacter sp.]
IDDQLNEEAEKLNAVLLIVGSRADHDRGIFGSSTTSIVQHATHPVLAVPEGYTCTAPRVAVLATDLSPMSEGVLSNLRSIVHALSLELHLVHVVAEDRGESHEELMNSLGSLRADFKTIISKDLSDGIEAYTKELSADLVITLPHSRSWLEGLFMKKHTKELVTELHLPLLCIPEG